MQYSISIYHLSISPSIYVIPCSFSHISCITTTLCNTTATTATFSIQFTTIQHIHIFQVFFKVLITQILLLSTPSPAPTCLQQPSSVHSFPLFLLSRATMARQAVCVGTKVLQISQLPVFTYRKITKPHFVSKVSDKSSE